MGCSVLVLLLLAATVVCVGASGAGQTLDSFSKLLVDEPSPANLRQYLATLTTYPHVFGVRNVTVQLINMLKTALAPIPNATIETVPFSAWSSLPVSIRVVLSLNGTDTTLSVNETCFNGTDPCWDTVTPLWGAYSPSGSTDHADVVYGNYCRDSDYAYLEARGIFVRGRVVICRYGKIFRAQKVQYGESRGAVGVLIYSDPADDGFTRAEEFPKGPARPPGGGQRGSYSYGQFCPGDIDPSRLEERGCGNVTVVPSIPLQPISWSAAQPILASLRGEPVAFEDGWQGGLPFHYHFGPGPAKITMQLEMDARRRDGFNVITTIPGTGPLSEEVVGLGCHMDAWVVGASDPLSGQAVMVELARIFGLMWSKGWRPQRTIVLFHWDGEEYNLLGSTDYTDKNANATSDNMVAYVNIDGIVGNWFPDRLVMSVSSSPVLADLFTDALLLTPTPIDGVNTSSLFTDGFQVLGDGSDYCSFINRLGVASLDIQWDSPGLPEPQYHSLYDSFFTMSTIVDPEFRVHKASVTLVGLIMYNLASSSALHLSPSFAAQQYASYKTQLLQQFPNLTSLDWTGFDAALASFTETATAAQAQVDAGNSDVNSALYKLDRNFLVSEGLPGRQYFRHVLQAPDLLNDYNSQILPGVAFYAPSNELQQAQAQLNIVAKVLADAGAVVATVLPPPDNTAVKISVIVVGVAFFVAIVLITLKYLWRRRANKRAAYTELPQAQ